MKNFCILSAIIVGIICPLLVADYYSQNGFLEDFMKNQSLSIMGNILAIYIGIITAFTVILDKLSSLTGGKFLKTTTTLKKNVLQLLFLYALQALILVGTPEKLEEPWIFFIKSIEIMVLSLYFLFFYEIIEIFFTTRNISANKETNQPPKSS